MNENEFIDLQKDCDGFLIPSGDSINLWSMFNISSEDYKREKMEKGLGKNIIYGI